MNVFSFQLTSNQLACVNRTKIGTWFRLFHRTLFWESHDFDSAEKFIEFVHFYAEDLGVMSLNRCHCIGGQVYGDVEDGTW